MNKQKLINIYKSFAKTDPCPLIVKWCTDHQGRTLYLCYQCYKVIGVDSKGTYFEVGDPKTLLTATCGNCAYSWSEKYFKQQ